MANDGKDEGSFQQEVEETQLAANRPQINSQLRVQAAMNTPTRALSLTEDSNHYLGTSMFSPFAMRQPASVVSSATPHAPSYTVPMSLAEVEQQALVKNALKDFTTTAVSSHRAGKKDIEALAYSSIGIIHDNLGNFKAAISSYQQYLQLSIEIGDVSGQRKALNFLGVDNCLIAQKLLEDNANALDEAARKHLHAAVSYHVRHSEIADEAGKFVAYNNLGVCHDLLTDLVESGKSHQNALRIAITLQSVHGQSVSVGNLGSLALKKQDLVMARTCFDQVASLHQ